MLKPALKVYKCFPHNSSLHMHHSDLNWGRTWCCFSGNPGLLFFQIKACDFWDVLQYFNLLAVNGSQRSAVLNTFLFLKDTLCNFSEEIPLQASCTICLFRTGSHSMPQTFHSYLVLKGLTARKFVSKSVKIRRQRDESCSLIIIKFISKSVKIDPDRNEICSLNTEQFVFKSIKHLSTKAWEFLPRFFKYSL